MMNFDNAIYETTSAYPDYVGACRKVENTDENEPCWLVTFQERNIGGKELLIEVILRDGGIVMSILSARHLTHTEMTNLANTFTRYLEITPE